MGTSRKAKGKGKKESRPYGDGDLHRRLRERKRERMSTAAFGDPVLFRGPAVSRAGSRAVAGAADAMGMYEGAHPHKVNGRAIATVLEYHALFGFRAEEGAIQRDNHGGNKLRELATDPSKFKRGDWMSMEMVNRFMAFAMHTQPPSADLQGADDPVSKYTIFAREVYWAVKNKDNWRPAEPLEYQTPPLDLIVSFLEYNVTQADEYVTYKDAGGRETRLKAYLSRSDPRKASDVKGRGNGTCSTDAIITGLQSIESRMHFLTQGDSAGVRALMPSRPVGFEQI